LLAEHRLYTNPESFIYQIFLNLLSNAIKFSPPHSTITLSSKTEGDEVIWKIRDQGKGIDEQALQTEGFSEPGTSGESGSGLGIKIAILIGKKQDINLNWKNDAGTIVTISQKKAPLRERGFSYF
jgi:K+-sensing histidine kinase KdpD